MMKVVASVIAATMLVSLVGTASAQALKPEEMIKFRKAGFSFMAWNMGRIKANLDGSYNREQVLAAANVIAATANSGFVDLFAPGTGQDVAGEKTRVKPELFEQPDKIKQLVMNLGKEAGELAKVAATGDAAAVKAQFGKTGGACKACHDDFRKN